MNKRRIFYFLLIIFSTLLSNNSKAQKVGLYWKWRNSKEKTFIISPKPHGKYISTRYVTGSVYHLENKELEKLIKFIVRFYNCVINKNDKESDQTFFIEARVAQKQVELFIWGLHTEYILHKMDTQVEEVGISMVNDIPVILQISSIEQKYFKKLPVMFMLPELQNKKKSWIYPVFDLYIKFEEILNDDLSKIRVTVRLNVRGDRRTNKEEFLHFFLEEFGKDWQVTSRSGELEKIIER